MIAPDAPILIADDVPHMCRLLVSYLQEMGFTNFTLVGNGEEVVAAAKQHPYALMFLDIEMPLLDGLAALRDVHWMAPDTPVVMISSQGTHQNVVRAVQLGAKGFLVKPYNKQKVEDVVKHLRGG